LFLALSGFFSSAETAFMSADRMRLHHLADQGHAAAKRLLQLRGSPTRLLAALLLGNNLVNIAAASIATAVAIRFLGEDLGIFVATAVTTLSVLIFCEVIPKTWAAINPERAGFLMIHPVRWVLLVLSPFVWLLQAITGPIVRIMAGDAPTRRRISEAEIRTMVRVGAMEGAIDRHENRLIQRVLDMGDTELHQIMTPLDEVQSISNTTPLREVLALLTAEGYSRLPVWEESPNEFVGIVHLKDVAQAARDNPEGPVADLLHPAHTVAPKEKVDDVLFLMKGLAAQMVIVVGDNEEVLGIATLEDLLEEIVGEIRDEHDTEEDGRLRHVGRDEAIAIGSVTIHEIEDVFGIDLPKGDYKTLQGLIRSRLGRPPAVGDVVSAGETEIRVEAVAKKRITRARLKRVLSQSA
jgi:CBS domain containing-hemolysin-like protein